MNATAMGSAENGQPGLRQVDAAVRSVLAGILGVDVGKGREPAIAKRSDEPQMHAGRLFGLRHAEAIGAGVRAVWVAPGTVVTPLAKDFLKRAGVAIRWVSRDEVGEVRNAGEWGFLVEDEVRSGVVEAFRRSLLEGPEAWHELAGSLELAADWVAEADARGVLVLAAEASTPVYRACRKRRVRASSATEPDTVARAVRALGVNLLVVEPAWKSIATLKQIGATFRRAGGPVVPAWIESGADRGGVS